ncbi:hypothetical protein WA026_018773, partial [Henosepilachna vigintioctopunctata]
SASNAQGKCERGGKWNSTPNRARHEAFLIVSCLKHLTHKHGRQMMLRPVAMAPNTPRHGIHGNSNERPTLRGRTVTIAFTSVHNSRVTLLFHYGSTLQIVREWQF